MLEKYKIVLATSNQHKVKECKNILLDLNMPIFSVEEKIGFCPEVIEDQTSFEGNASKKAMEIANMLDDDNNIVIADDSGLQVEGLNNQPGVYSARYAGENATAQDNIKKLLDNMSNITNRKACFVCCIALVINNQLTFCSLGEIKGTISTEISVTKDVFGYDPIFIPNKFKKTFSQLSSSEKNSISHRAIALNKVKDFLKKNLM